MVPDPLSLGPKLYDTVHDPIPVGSLVWGWTHFKAQVELKYHNESVRDMASGPLDLGLYGIWPQAHWTSTQQSLRPKLSLNLIVSPHHFGYIIGKPMFGPL